MNNTLEDTKLFLPSNPIIKTATLKAFKKMRGVNMDAAEDFINKAGGVSVPPPLGVKADLIFGVIYGNITLKPTSDHTNCVFDHAFWGIGAEGGSAIGFMYTAASSWDLFFRSIAGFHVQSLAGGAGILQVNFFLDNGLPVGQFNGALGGAGGVEGGNKGTWSCS